HSLTNKTTLLAIVLLLSAFRVPQSAIANPTEEALDMIIHNGTIITMEDSQSYVTVVGVSGDKITYTGNDTGLLDSADSNTKMINLQGNTLLPGFIDAHSHWIRDRESQGFSSDQEIISYILERGWTSVNELFMRDYDIENIVALDSQDELKVRVNCYMPVSWQYERFGDWYKNYTPGYEYSSKVRIAGIKIFSDSWIGEYTKQYFQQTELNNLVQEAHSLGYQIAIHSTSEPSTDIVLNAFENAITDQTGDYRHRMEHLVLLRDDQIQKMKNLGIIASIQLSWYNSNWEDATLNHVGLENVSLVARWRDILAAGVKSIGSTDYPYVEEEIESIVQVMYNAVTRKANKTSTPSDWLLSQTLTIEQVIGLLTIDAAYGTFQEDVKGSIKEGKFADFVILSENPFQVDAEQLLDVDIMATIIGGKIEYNTTNFEIQIEKTTSTGWNVGFEVLTSQLILVSVIIFLHKIRK
ncbi:MAG: amidohydrolase, partial [Promethearchaeota archaeon]